MHQPTPFAVAEEGYDGVEGVEDTIEWNPFIPIETGAYGIHQYPCEPLLKILPRQHPHAYYAQGCGEGVGDGHSAGGPRVQYQI